MGGQDSKELNGNFETLKYFRNSFREYPGDIKVNILLTVSMIMQKGNIPVEAPYICDLLKKPDEVKSDPNEIMTWLNMANWGHRIVANQNKSYLDDFVTLSITLWTKMSKEGDKKMPDKIYLPLSDLTLDMRSKSVIYDNGR